MEGIQQLASYWMEWQIRGLVLALLILLIAAPVHWRSPLWRHWVLISGAMVLLVYPMMIIAFPHWEIPVIPSQILLDPFSAPIQVEFREPSTSIWPTLLFVTSFLFSSILILRYLGACLRLRRRIEDGTKPGKDLDFVFTQCAIDVGLDPEKIELVVGSANEVPCTFGWLKPKVLLPVNLMEWPAEDRRIVLIHELQHIKRKDWLWQQFTVVALILYPLNPCVWKLKSLARKLAEESVDKLSLSSNIPPMEYANTLLRQLRHCQQMRSSVAVHMYQRLDIVDRVSSLIAEPYSWQKMGRMTSIQLSLLVLLMAIPLATIQPVRVPVEQRPRISYDPVDPEIENPSEPIDSLPIWEPREPVTPIADPELPPSEELVWEMTADEEPYETESLAPVITSVPETIIPIEPRSVHMERPSYPELDLRRGREATVEVIFDLDDQGQVINPRISGVSSGVRGVSTHRFEEAVLAAISASRYEISEEPLRPLITSGLTETYVFELVDDRRAPSSTNVSQNPP